MAGMLTPIPHTPLAERLRAEGRLREAEYSGNNTDDEVQFQPRRMTAAQMRRGYYKLLNALFSSGAVYRRATALLQRLEPHIFSGVNMRRADFWAALRSLWLQGVVRASRRAYLRLLWTGWRRDYLRRNAARRVARRLRGELRGLTSSQSRAAEQVTGTALLPLLAPAREALLRSHPARSLEEIDAWIGSVRGRIDRGETTRGDMTAVYRAGHEFFVRQYRLHRFPGACLVKAFNLAIKGLHYELVTEDIVPQRP
jgi:hypothetical protein